MKLILTFIVSVLFNFSLELEESFQNRVFNGHQVESIEFPCLARIRILKDGRHYVCTGSLISHYYVLTAAHCVASPAEEITVRLGIDHVYDVDGKTITCKQCWIIYPEYETRGPTAKLDIALIKLPTYVNFTDRISPIQLPSYQDVEADLVGEIGKVIGWGNINLLVNDSTVESSPKVPMAAEASVLDQETCVKLFSDVKILYDPKHEFCTSHLETGSCGGDSGGPFIVKGKQFGIVSGGTDIHPITKKEHIFCAPNYADDYIDITKFLKWIEQNSDVKID